MSGPWDATVIGGGFYGLYLADYLARRFGRVLLCERENDVMCRASLNNQARVHHGYHYPRSVLTALRSRVNFPRFVEEFRPAIDASFTQLYAIARNGSKVSAAQFYRFMQRIGTPIRPAGQRLNKLFDPALTEEVFWTQEHAFNANLLKQLLLERVRRAAVELRLETAATRVRQVEGNAVEVELCARGGVETVVAARVFCCAYSQINSAVKDSGLECIPLKHELTEVALVEVPEALRDLGVTVMDGPFFSCMPFPARGLHSLTHVRYTPHRHWYDGGPVYRPAPEVLKGPAPPTAFPHMLQDARRYLPSLRECRYQGSLWEVKTVLPRSEVDDSRPILFQPHYGLRNFHVIMGAKIDNVYDVIDALSGGLV